MNLKQKTTMKIWLPVAVLAILLSGCKVDTTTPLREQAYNAQRETAEESGLIALRPYPNADSVCQELGKNALTESFFILNDIVIGCPRHADEARAELSAAGFKDSGSTRSWVIYAQNPY